MKLISDFLPVLIFFVAYKIYGIFVATGVLIIASAVQIGYLWFRYRKVEVMHIITFLLVLIFGGTTIWLHDAIYLKWKVSIINWLFGAAFLATQFLGPKTAIQFLFDSSAGGNPKQQLALPKMVWHRLNAMWALYFIVIGTINLYVVYHFSTKVWVDFKVFGMLGLTFIFIVIQSLYLYRHLKK